MMEVADYALTHGYTVCWDGDVSEKGFSFKNGVAINPVVKKAEDLSGSDRARFEKMDPKEQKEMLAEATNLKTVSRSKCHSGSPSGRL